MGFFIMPTNTGTYLVVRIVIEFQFVVQEAFYPHWSLVVIVADL